MNTPEIPTPFNSVFVCRSTTISASPSKVRETFLDFDKIPEWDSRSIEALAARRAGSGEPITGMQAQPGDQVTVTSGQMGKQEAVIFMNNSSAFGMKGGALGFVAHHWYEFLPSSHVDGETLFKNCETLEGGVALMFGSWSPLRRWMEGLFDEFNDAVKRAVERETKEGEGRRGGDWK